jgi:hypothetical protein
LAHNIRLEPSGEDLVNDTIAVVWVCGWKRIGFFTVAMHHIQCSNEELVRILLFIACQMPCMCPDKMQQAMQRQGSLITRVELKCIKNTSLS